jgi:hypothetical protein
MGDPLLTTPRILWASLLMSQLIYAYLLLFAAPHPDAPPDPMLPMVLAAAAFGVAIASFVVPAVLSRSMASQPTAPIMGHEDAAAARRRAMSARFVPFIVSLAMSEAVSIFGLVVGWLGHPLTTWAPFLVAGMLLTAWRFPTEARMLGPTTRGNGVTVG